MIPDSKRLITMWDLPLNRGGVVGGFAGAAPFLWNVLSSGTEGLPASFLLPLLCVGSLAGNAAGNLLSRGNRFQRSA